MAAFRTAGLAGAAALMLSGCGGLTGGLFGGGAGGSGSGTGGTAAEMQTEGVARESRANLPPELRGRASRRSSFLDLFTLRDDPNVTLEVNRYLWMASLDVLDFLPIESADPFSGVIAFGYGTPPGGGVPYRATVHVQDPAMDARSLRVAIATRGGPVADATVRAVEDAILTRARQLRIRDDRL